PEAAIDAWLAETTDADPWMLRALAVQALALREPDAPAVRAALDDPTPRVRLAGVEALLRASPSREDLLTVARVARRDPWPLGRAGAARGLGWRPERAPILAASNGDPSRLVRAAAIEGATSGRVRRVSAAVWERL